MVCGLATVPSMPRERPQLPVAWLAVPVSLLLLAVPLVWLLNWESPAVSAGTGYPVRIMTYNLHNGFDTDGHLGMEAIAKVIEAEQPDVVGLQEVSRGWVVNGSLDMLTWLSQRLEMPYIFGSATGSLWGNAILSRYPILEWENVKLPPKDLLFQRAYLWARLDLGDGQELRVVVTHLHHTREDFDIRARQVQTLLDFWKDGEQTVIMGDFNARRDDFEAEMMRQAGICRPDRLGRHPAGVHRSIGCSASPHRLCLAFTRLDRHGCRHPTEHGLGSFASGCHHRAGILTALLSLAWLSKPFIPQGAKTSFGGRQPKASCSLPNISLLSRSLGPTFFPDTRGHSTRPPFPASPRR